MGRTVTARLCNATLLLALLLASAAGSAAVPEAHPANGAPSSRLTAFGGRSTAQLRSGAGSRLDASLASLVRHLDRVRRGHEIEDLHALNPAARFIRRGEVPLVLIDAVTRGDPQQLRQTLLALGLQHPAVYANDLSGWLPVGAINTAASRAPVLAMRASIARARATVLATQGDFAQGTSALKAAVSTLTGSGVNLGVLSDSFNCYAVYEQPGSGVNASGHNGYAPFGFATDDATFDESNGYLTASVSVLSEAECLGYGAPLELPFADEGRAMLQIVHAVAPGASLSFYSAANGEADFANGIAALANAGAKVIADDVGYFDEPFFQDGIVAQAVTAAAAKGVAYFSAAGNNRANSYDNDAPQFASAGRGPLGGDKLLNFDASGATTTTSLSVAIPRLAPGQFIGLVLEWDQPYVTGAAGSPGARSSLDLCVSGTGGYAVFDLDGSFMSCTGANAQGTDPVQVLILGNPANAGSPTAAGTISLQVGLANATSAPGRVKLVVEDDGAGSTIQNFATNSATVQGHPGAAGAAAVAAAFFPVTPLCGHEPAVLEEFSSKGGEPILFNTSGTRLATPQLRQKPDFTAPDGVNTSFFGAPLADYPSPDDSDTSGVAACQNNATYNNFFGTSAATPHAAAAAALMLQAIPSLTPALVLGALRATAAPMSASTPNFESGYGFLQAAKLADPVVWFPSSSVSVGNSTTLSWVALNATSCSGTAGLTGTQPRSGTLSVTPTATGSTTYTLTCQGSAGPQVASATLQAVPTLAISTSSLPSGTAGTPYTASLAATGGVTPYTWTLTSGALPAGLSFDGATGQISGTPSASAAATIIFVVSDAEQPTLSKSVSVTLSVAAAAAGSSSGPSGGGALDPPLLVLLACLLAARLPRRGLRAPSALELLQRREHRLPVG